jgi:hypothetical protein
VYTPILSLSGNFTAPTKLIMKIIIAFSDVPNVIWQTSADGSGYSVCVTIKLDQVTVIFLFRTCTWGSFFYKITLQIHALDEYDKRTRKITCIAVISLVLMMQAAR